MCDAENYANLDSRVRRARLAAMQACAKIGKEIPGTSFSGPPPTDKAGGISSGIGAILGYIF